MNFKSLSTKSLAIAMVLTYSYSWASAVKELSPSNEEVLQFVHTSFPAKFNPETLKIEDFKGNTTLTTPVGSWEMEIKKNARNASNILDEVNPIIFRSDESTAMSCIYAVMFEYKDPTIYYQPIEIGFKRK